ncbi:MAG: sporulation protein YhbH [Chloroflexota bacterium]|nr:sporulation protein YhbH [Chloroflexota bacterium]
MPNHIPHARTVSLSQQDWSLHRKGPADQARHNEKVKEAIRDNLADIISEQSIITSDGKKIVKVPIRSLEEYKFRFGEPPPEGQVGQGDGGSQVGDVIERAGRPGQGPGSGAGEQPGIDYYEAELTVDELAALLFEDLGLPRLEPKRSQELESETVRFTDIRRSGPFSNLDKRRTIRENLKRNALAGQARFGDIKNDDLRFKTWERAIRHESNAVVLALMDVSGSMGPFEKYVSRAFYFWMVKFLRTKYARVEIVFIAHHTEAKEVTEEEFFSRGESGGTKASSAYRLALEIIDARYPASGWNIYPFHFSDGDNWPSDNAACRALAEQLLARSNQLGYGEIRPGLFGGRHSYSSTLMSAFERIDDPKFQSVVISDKADVYPALRTFFASDDEGQRSQV